MNMLKTLLLSTMLVLPLKAEILSGNDCGADCVWTYDTEKKELIFKGSGTISNPGDIGTSGFKGVINPGEVKNIVVGEGFSELGGYLFYHVGDGTTSVSLPKTLRTAGTALTHCGGIKTIDCASEDISFNYLSMQGVKNLIIPASDKINIVKVHQVM